LLGSRLFWLVAGISVRLFYRIRFRGLKRRWSIRIGILSRLMVTVRWGGRFRLSSHRWSFISVTLAMLRMFTAGLGVLSGRVRGLCFVHRLVCFIRVLRFLFLRTLIVNFRHVSLFRVRFPSVGLMAVGWARLSILPGKLLSWLMGMSL